MSYLRDAYFLPAAAEAIELRAFTHGLMPKTVPAMMDRFVSDWQQRGVDAWNEVPNHWKSSAREKVGWWTLPVYLGDNFIAPLLGASSGTCIMQPNVHWIVQCLLSSRELFRSRKKVIFTEAEFPSVKFSLSQCADIYGLELTHLPLHDASAPIPQVLDAIDGDTALVMLSHVGFTTGERLPDSTIRRIADKVHKAGGLLAIDGYHGIGCLEASVEALGVDLYFGGLLKEGSGSTGNAFLYIRENLEITPRLTGWFGDAEPFGFKKIPERHLEVRHRFLGGTTAIASLYHAVEGVRLLLDMGIENLRIDCLQKTSRCIELADAAGLKLRSPRDGARRSAMVIFELPAAHAMVQYLKRHQIYTDSRQRRYLRLAPFVWNTFEEIERTFDAISTGLAGNRYMKIPDIDLSSDRVQLDA